MVRLLLLFLLIATAAALQVSPLRSRCPMMNIAPANAQQAQAASTNYYNSVVHFCATRGDDVRQHHDNHLRVYAETRRTELVQSQLTKTEVPVPQVTLTVS